MSALLTDLTESCLVLPKQIALKIVAISLVLGLYDALVKDSNRELTAEAYFKEIGDIFPH